MLIVRLALSSQQCKGCVELYTGRWTRNSLEGKAERTPFIGIILHINMFNRGRGFWNCCMDPYKGIKFAGWKLLSTRQKKQFLLSVTLLKNICWLLSKIQFHLNKKVALCTLSALSFSNVSDTARWRAMSVSPVFWSKLKNLRNYWMGFVHTFRMSPLCNLPNALANTCKANYYELIQHLIFSPK